MNHPKIVDESREAYFDQCNLSGNVCLKARLEETNMHYPWHRVFYGTPIADNEQQFYWVGFRGDEGDLHFCHVPMLFLDGKWRYPNGSTCGLKVEYWLAIDIPALPKE